MNINSVTQGVSNDNKAKHLNNDKLKKTCQDFESIFVGYMLKNMRKNTMQSDLVEKGMGEEVFTDMLDDEYSKLISKTGKIGLADIIYKQLNANDKSENDINKVINDYRNNNIRSKIPVQDFQDEKISTNQNNIDNDLLKRIGKFNSIINVAARNNKLSPNLLKGVIAQESKGYSDAISLKGAKGLMQIIDTTSKELGVNDPFNPAENINGGAKYLRTMLDRFDNNLEKALAAYNAGPQAVKDYNGIPPYNETQNYVKSVMNYFNMFKDYYGG